MIRENSSEYASFESFKSPCTVNLESADLGIKGITTYKRVLQGNNEMTVELDKFEITSNYWLVSALSAGVLLGFADYFGQDIGHVGMQARLYVGTGHAMAAIIYLTFKTFLQEKSENEDEVRIQFDTSTEQKLWTTMAIVVDSILSVGWGLLFSIIFGAYYYAPINQGVIDVLFSFTPIYLMIFCSFIFKEKVNVQQIISIGVLICGVTIYAVSVTPAHKYKSDNEAPVAPILLALGSSLYFMLRCLGLKTFHIIFNFNPADFVAMSYLTCGSIVYGTTVWYTYQHSIDWSLFKDCIACGLLEGFGMMAMLYGICTGHSGAAAAVATVQIPVKIILFYIFMSQAPTILQLISLILSMIGILFIISGPAISSIVKTKSTSNRDKLI